jgi:hypothetical protein
MTERIRLTISVTPEVHEVFSRMAELSGGSLGKTMGDWLGDTIEGAQFVALKMQEARKAPMTVMREFQAYARGASHEIDGLVDQVRAGLAADRAMQARPARQVGRQAPPSSNTGGKVPQENPKRRGGKGS